jgi:hypothetical protein
MKQTKKLIHQTFIFSSLLGLLFFGTNCSKKTSPEPSAPAAKQSDQAGSTAANGAMDDVNDYINNNLGGGSSQTRLDESANTRLEEYKLPCGIVSVDTSTTVNGHRLYKMKYGDRSDCINQIKKKSGEVSFQLTNGTAFNQQGVVFKITYTNYMVEILATNDVVTINGSIYITNVTGGYIWEAVTKSSTIQHRVRGTFNITYANGETRQRQYYQLRTWASSNGWAGLSFAVAGDTSINSVNVSEIGYTLDGKYYFETQILTDYKWSNCGTTYAGPYVLKVGNARMNVNVPNITPAYFNVEAGYYYNTTTGNGLKTNDCSTNAYKIDILVGTTSSTQYQLY